MKITQFFKTIVTITIIGSDCCAWLDHFFDELMQVIPGGVFNMP
jgi:hypothetical protein